LLHIARIQDDNYQVNKTTLDLSEMLERAIESFRPLSDKKKIQLVKNIEPNLILSADPDKIYQVVSNLLSNAIKFSDGGTIHILLKRDGKSVHCSVKDQGKGIETKYLAKIFDRFFQVDAGSKGSGIGLTIAKAWVEAHDGKIRAESEGVGTGTKIIFSMPVLK
jgi:signal transduction histidine kinase